MERVGLKGGVELSRIAYGMWRVGEDADTSPGRIRAKIEACLDQGITTVDQAAVYGGYTSEDLLGDCLRQNRGLRERIEIVTKCGIVAPVGRHAEARVKHYDTSEAHIVSSVDHSLRSLGTDYIDLLLIHRPDPFMDHTETGGALDSLVRSGKVRAVGVSNFKVWDWKLLQSAMETPLATNQIEISLAEPHCFEDGDIAHLQELRVPPMAWSPLGGGSLFGEKSGGELRTVVSKVAMIHGVDEAAVAVAWLLRHPARIIPVMGSNTLSRIAAFSDALRIEMDRETWFELYTAALGRDVA